MKLYICGSEKAPKFAGALPKFSETFPLLGSELGKSLVHLKVPFWAIENGLNDSIVTCQDDRNNFANECQQPVSSHRAADNICSRRTLRSYTLDARVLSPEQQSAAPRLHCLNHTRHHRAVRYHHRLGLWLTVRRRLMAACACFNYMLVSRPPLPAMQSVLRGLRRLGCARTAMPAVPHVSTAAHLAAMQCRV